MKKEPLVYGITHDELVDDPELGKRRRELIMIAARGLEKIKMITIDDDHYFTSTNIGRIASNYYIKHSSIETFKENLRDMMTESDILDLIGKSSEFNDLKSREEEAKELASLKETYCYCDTRVTSTTIT